MHGAQGPGGPGGGIPPERTRSGTTGRGAYARRRLLAIFIVQSTQKVEVAFFGWNGRAPLAATLLIAAAAGALVVACAGVLRILQLRRRVKRERTAM